MNKTIIYTIGLVTLFSGAVLISRSHSDVFRGSPPARNLSAATVYSSSLVHPVSTKSDESVTFLFVGDIMFDRGVANHARKYGIDSLFEGVQDLLTGNDAIIGNLEGTITTSKSVAQSDYSILHFTFDPKFADLLKSVNFTGLSLANNHSMDFYKSGFLSTQKYLDSAGLKYFGSAYNDYDLSTKITIKDKDFCLIGYNDTFTFDESPALAEIVKIRSSCNYLIVFAHWGIEYETEASPRQIILAHEFIDSGADLIIGAHPHVVQPVEIYRNKAIFYSLGNFVFDQGISFETEHSLAVKVTFAVRKQSFELIPTSLDHAEVSVAGSTDVTRILKQANKESRFELIQ